MKYIALALLVLFGVQSYRLASETAAHAKTVADHATHLAAVDREIAATTTKLRTLEQRLAQRNLEIANEQARLKADADRRVADAQRAAASLRDTLYALGRRERPADPAAARWFDATTTARRLVGECSDRRQEVAEAADGLRTQVIGLQRYVAEVCLAANVSKKEGFE